MNDTETRSDARESRYAALGGAATAALCLAGLALECGVGAALLGALACLGVLALCVGLETSE